MGQDTASEEKELTIVGRLYVFMGKSAAGKDTLYHQVMERYPKLLPVIPYTTRPIRAGEEEGREYYFVTEERFRELERAGQIVEYRCYQTVQGPWYYFTADDGQIDLAGGDYCLISTLEGYRRIRAFYGADHVVPLYIHVPDLLRIRRALEREGQQDKPCVAEVCRRFLADEQDFSWENLSRAGVTEAIPNEDSETALRKIHEVMMGTHGK